MSVDRATALRSLHPSRTEGLPPPPIRAVPTAAPVADEREVVIADDAINPDDVALTGELLGEPAPLAAPLVVGDPEPIPAAADAAFPTNSLDDAVNLDEAVNVAVEGPFTFRSLVDRPQATCKAMTDERLQQPSKPLNVNITPATAEAFDDRCRAMRLKKKDVVEVLLRAWLAASTDR